MNSLIKIKKKSRSLKRVKVVDKNQCDNEVAESKLKIKKRKIKKNMLKNYENFHKTSTVSNLQPNESIPLNLLTDDESSNESVDDLIKAVEKSKYIKLKNCQINEPTRKTSKRDENVEKSNEKLSLNLTSDDFEYFDSDFDCTSSDLYTDFEYTQNFNYNNQLSDFVDYYTTSTCSIFVLKHPSKLYLHGKLSISVLSGCIEIFGHKLDEDSKEIEIYSGKSTGLLSITTLEGTESQHSDNRLRTLNLNEDAIKSIITMKDVCVLSFRKLENNLTKSLEDYFTHSFFPKVYPSSNKTITPVEIKLQTYFGTNECGDVFKKNKNWDSDIVNKINADTRLFVCGGQGVGKSSFLRYTVNKLLNRFEKVVFIDLDIGQPEFTIPGNVSVNIVRTPLFGPNYTHVQKPERCVFIGDVNVMNYITRYLNSIQDLMEYCVKNIDNSVPWLINYMGFTRSLGLDLILFVLQHVNPNTVVQIQSHFGKLNFPHPLTLDYVQRQTHKKNTFNANLDRIRYDLKIVQSTIQQKTSQKKSQIDRKLLRETVTIAYFSDILSSNGEQKLPTYSVSLSSIKLSQVDGIKENLLAIINGRLVALCSNDADVCLGFGVVRGIDAATNTLYLITPESKDVMENVKHLVVGFITLPTSFYLNMATKGNSPYISIMERGKTTSIPKRSYISCEKLFKKSK